MNAPYHNKALPEGSILREWQLEEVLGVGGFGIVYRGKDIHFGESVAIKEYFPGSISDRIDGTTVTPTDSSSEEIYQLGRQKFMEEAKVLWSLSHPQRHPNLVAVRSLFEVHGTAYMVMDFESGVSLSQLLREGKHFDEKTLLAIIRPIAEGLERAHQAGVLHRDIKPGNILINKDCRPVLIDFGSARFESGNATNTKVTFYTPPYAAIEQYVKSFPQGPWTDIYALGVVLYQCITGEKPPEVLERMHGEDGSLLSSREWPGFSPAFSRAVDAAMSVRPLERPATITSWLKMFDAANSAPMDEPTRIAYAMPSPRTAAQEVVENYMPQVSSVLQPGPETQTMATPESVTITEHAADNALIASKLRMQPERRKLPIVALGIGAGAILLGTITFFGFSLWRERASLPMAPNPTAHVDPAIRMPATAGGAATNAALAAKMDALIDTAKRTDRKESEIAALTDAKTELANLVAGKADSDRLSTEAEDMAKTENNILLRAEKRMMRDIDASSGTTSGNAKSIANLLQSKTQLDAKLKPALSQNAAQIIDSTRDAIAAFATFQDAYGAALPALVADKHKAFENLHAATQALCDQVTSLANVDKPWFLAASARKDAYKLRQDDAEQAKTLSAQLNDLAAKIASTNDLSDLTAAINQATAANKSANALYAASYAAKP